jgi:prepilin signal peptidase PulO-like enzyme (type II secretory pathway)
VHGGSRCPRCHTAIKWHDNLPVIGWLNLNGRCRSCDLPIASRYPIVESICAGLCTAIYFRELLSGGANLPGRPPDFQHGGMLKLFPNLEPDLIGLWLYHCGMLCVLLVWGLIAWDGRRVPSRSVLAVLSVATALAVVFPTLHPLGLTGEPSTILDATDAMDAWGMQGLGVSVAGGVAGLLLGLVLQWLFGRLLHGDASGRTGQPLGQPHALGIGLALLSNLRSNLIERSAHLGFNFRKGTSKYVWIDDRRTELRQPCLKFANAGGLIGSLAIRIELTFRGIECTELIRVAGLLQ